ncbi:MAG: response regulator, partial [Bacilli bacterium]|nr:response regulator [Bacilli bacterium]
VAVETVKDFKPETFDFVLMDIQMPIMDGLESAKRIRKISGAENLPIIALSANAFVEDKQKSIAAGMNDHVAKPIDKNLLFETLSKYLK